MFDITINKHEDTAHFLKATKHNWIWKITLDQTVTDKYIKEAFRYQAHLYGNVYYTYDPKQYHISKTTKTADQARIDAEAMVKKVCAMATKNREKDIEIADSKITYTVDC